MVPKFRSCYCSVLQLCQKIPRVLCNPKVLYGAHNGQPLASILSQINPAHSLPSCLRSTLMLATSLRLAFPNVLFPMCSPPKLSMQFSFPPPPNAPHAPPFRFDHSNKIWWQVPIMLLLTVSCPPVFLGTLFSNTLERCSLCGTDHFLQPFKTSNGNIIGKVI